MGFVFTAVEGIYRDLSFQSDSKSTSGFSLSVETMYVAASSHSAIALGSKRDGGSASWVLASVAARKISHRDSAMAIVDSRIPSTTHGCTSHKSSRASNSSGANLLPEVSIAPMACFKGGN